MMSVIVEQARYRPRSAMRPSMITLVSSTYGFAPLYVLAENST